MAKRAGLSMGFYIGGYDLSGDASGIDTLSGARATLPTTGINKSSMERAYGRGDGEISWSTWFNDAAGQEHSALKGLPTSDVLVIVDTGGSAGDPAAMLLGKQINYDWSRPGDGSLAGSIQALNNGVPLEWGETIIALSTITAAGQSTSQDNGGSSTAGAAVMFMCTAFSGTNYTGTVQDSSDDTTFATLIAMTQITAVNQAERKTVTGTVDRYTRVDHAGTFTSVDVIFVLRRGDANDIPAY